MRSILNLIENLLAALLFGDVYVVVDSRFILEYLLASSFIYREIVVFLLFFLVEISPGRGPVVFSFWVFHVKKSGVLLYFDTVYFRRV